MPISIGYSRPCRNLGHPPNGFRVKVCGIHGPRMRGTGAPSFMVWKHPGIGPPPLLYRINVGVEVINGKYFYEFYP